MGRCFTTEDGKICFPSPGKDMSKKKKSKKRDLALGECRPVKGRAGIIFCRTGKGLTGYQFKKKGK